MITEVKISDLMPGPIAASKPHLSPGRVACYVAHPSEAGPVTVFDLDQGLLLADGHHRVEAATRRGETTVKTRCEDRYPPRRPGVRRSPRTRAAKCKRRCRA